MTKPVHVEMGQSDTTFSTISTDPIHACLFFLIDGVYKNINFAYLYRSSYGVGNNMELLQILRSLLTLFAKDLKLHLSGLCDGDVDINQLDHLYMFVGGGTISTRNNKRKAISLLINPNNLLYDQKKIIWSC
jgi:hypothetical protein